MNRREFSYAGGLSTEVGRYKNLQGLKQMETINEMRPNIVAIAETLRKGDRIMIWHDGYQVFIDEMGASNFNITNDLEKKRKKRLDKSQELI